MNNRLQSRAWTGTKMTTDFHLDSNGDVVARVGSFDPNQPKFIVMQSTSLKDKNGVLIYEGDILVHENNGPHNKWIGSIRLEKQDCNEFQYVIDTPPKTGYPKGSTIYNYWTDEDVEIIGDIYTNPDLLKT